MFRSMQETLSHEEDYKPLSAPSYGEDDELASILEDAVRDTLGPDNQHPGSNFETEAERCQQFGGSRTYEDILATAVLNKVLEKCDSSSQDFGEGGSLEHGGGTDTDSGLSGSIRGDALKRMGKAVSEGGASEGASEGSSSPLCESPKDNYPLVMASDIRRASPTTLAQSPDMGVGLEGLDGRPFDCSDIVWNFGNDGFSPLQFKIEEHIEEVTTHRLTDEESNNSFNESENDSATDGSNFSSSKKTKKGQPKNTFRKSRYASKISPEEVPQVLPPFDLPSITAEDIEGSRVPFPELGVDLLIGSSTTRDGGPSEFLLENSDWKDNWLFMKEKSRDIQTIHTGDAITMLIPNPYSMINPTIGDRDIDELSELSDRHSVYSFDTSSDEDESAANIPTVASKDLVDLVGEINAEFGQQDQEYTEDISALDRLQLSNTYKRNTARANANALIITEELTGVTPVYKSGNRTSANIYQPKKGVVKTFETKSEHSKYKPKITSKKMLKPNIILAPPEVVPQDITKTLNSSSSVWFESVPEDAVVPLGRALRLSCQVHSRQICGVSWYFEKELLASRDNVLTWKKGDIYHMNVYGIGEENVGTYSVSAYTKDDCVWSRCLVTSIDQGRATKIPRITLALSDVTAQRGSEVMIECQVAGHPEPKVTFMRNSIPVNPASGECFIENDKYGSWTLTFHEVKEDDSGQIKVIASNSLGHAMSFCNLKVIKEGQIDIRNGSQDVNSNFGNDRNSETERNAKNKMNPSSEVNNIRRRPNKSIKPKLNNINIGTYNEDRFQSSVNNSSVDSYSSSSLNTMSENYTNNNNYGNTQNITINGRMFQPPKPGTIAEREHRKWLEAKPITNNPYSPEKLADRLGKSPHRFPSLPTVYRETSGDESTDPSLRDCLLSSYSDLSRYSRDYHINDNKLLSSNTSANYNNIFRRLDTHLERPRCSTSLVKLEAKLSDNWKEELKDIKLDVGKKVADIQKTIDACQHEWQQRLQQRGWTPNNRLHNLKRSGQKLSASCINLHTPPKAKPFISGSSTRHLIYSSTETLNRDQSQNLWRTVSVDTLNPPFKYPFPSSGRTAHNQLYDKVNATNRETVDRRYSCPLQLSDSDDSNNLNTSYMHIKPLELNPYFHQNGYNNKKMTSYYSENSIESLKEESDTEDSLPMSGDNSNLPSVKELAYKFDSLKSLKNKASANRRHHEKLREARNKDVVIIEQGDQNNTDTVESPSFNPISRKYNNKFIVNEVRIGGKPTKIYASNFNSDYPRYPYKFDGFKRSNSQERESLHGSRSASAISSPSPLEVFTPSRKEHTHFSFDQFQYSNKHRNRFSTTDILKADEFWGNDGSYNLPKMRNLSASNSSMAESDISAVTLPVVPDSTSRDINELFGIKLRSGNLADLNNKNVHKSSSSDIFPLSKPIRPKSVPDFKEFQNLSDEENPDAMEYYDPVIARKHNMPKFYANVTTKPQKKYTLNSKSLHDIRSNELETYTAFSNSGAFSLDRATGNRMYNFLKKYENKKSLEDIPKYPSKITEADEIEQEKSNYENQIYESGSSIKEIPENVHVKETTEKVHVKDIPEKVHVKDIPEKVHVKYIPEKVHEPQSNFKIPMRPKIKKRGSMHDFLMMYANKTSLPVISNNEKIKVIEESNENTTFSTDLELTKSNYNIDEFRSSQKIETGKEKDINNKEKIQNSQDKIDVASSPIIENNLTFEYSETDSKSKQEEILDKSIVTEKEIETLHDNVTSEILNTKTEESINIVDAQPAIQAKPSTITLKSKNQVSTLYAFVNKPSIKPKPESLKSSTIRTKDNHLNTSDKKFTNQSLKTLPNENMYHQHTKVSKYHITPNSVYSQYLNNYSHLRSLKEKENESAFSDSEKRKAKEIESQTLHKEVQTVPKENNSNNQTKFSDFEESTVLQSSRNKGDEYRNTMKKSEVFNQDANITIKIDVQPINMQVGRESTQTSCDINVVTENVTNAAANTSKNINSVYFDQSELQENKLKIYKKNFTDFQKHLGQNEITASENEGTSDSINKNATVITSNEFKDACFQNKISYDMKKEIVEVINTKRLNVSPINTLVKSGKVKTTEDAVDSPNIKQKYLPSLEIKNTDPSTSIPSNSEPEQGINNGNCTSPEISYVDEERESTKEGYTKRRNQRPILMDTDEDSDPRSLTKRIIKGARYSTSGLVGSAYKASASLPEHSPFHYKPKTYDNIE